MNTPTIKERTAYQYNGRLHRTLPAAAKHAAWSMINKKYFPLEDTKKILDMTCDCADDHEFNYSGGLEQWKWEACLIHDREVGYFARLSRRMASAIVEKWQKESEK